MSRALLLDADCAGEGGAFFSDHEAAVGLGGQMGEELVNFLAEGVD